MNNDLISRKALRENVYAFYDSHFKGLVPIEVISYAKAVDDLIANAPTVKIDTNDIEYKAYCKGLENGKKIARPQNKWIKIFENPFTNGYLCPFCGHKIQVTEQFLPEVTECEYCGADMKGGAE